jgi:hypothetical protein
MGRVAVVGAVQHASPGGVCSSQCMVLVGFLIKVRPVPETE